MYSALRNLASTADEQLEYLAALGLQDNIDEIALEFDDIFGAFMTDSTLSEAVRNDLQKINERLDEMSDRKDLWTPAALKSRQEWAEIRSISRRVLDGLSVSK
ncbi:hypothetical protein [Candidatus Thiosymbion oneisti]|uniref:hypothetical protein n=1 Tax=Candidatus Thiosymbion oneisti TaxID=589554 RepID=UPI00114C921F|nr:hypothetical protein [Candidatus Thiosymbion oneisti]